MKYRRVTVTTADGTENYIVIDYDDGTHESFLAEAENPKYNAFLDLTETN
jgi:hypothetical protein